MKQGRNLRKEVKQEMTLDELKAQKYGSYGITLRERAGKRQRFPYLQLVV